MTRRCPEAPPVFAKITSDLMVSRSLTFCGRMHGEVVKDPENADRTYILVCQILSKNVCSSIVLQVVIKLNCNVSTVVSRSCLAGRLGGPYTVFFPR